jgi:hypothetical protein
MFGENAPWVCNGQILALPLETVESITAIKPAADAAVSVLSVENKETFCFLAHRMKDFSLSAVVCSSGHPNPAVTGLLRLFAATGGHIGHYGDLDPDGILILQEISAAVAAPVVPRFMTIDIFRKYVKFGYRLDKTQSARLALIDPRALDSVRTLAREIGQTGMGVEQEIIDVNELLRG